MFPKLQRIHVRLPAMEIPSLWKPISGDAEYLWEPRLVGVAALAAVANLAMRLECLKRLVGTELPDVWRKDYNSEIFSQMPVVAGQSSVITAALGSPTMQKAAEDIDADLTDGVLSTVSIAATTFTTLDDLGCWLLRQHPRLEEVQCSTAGAGLDMSWQRQLHQHEELQEPAVPDAADLCDIRLKCANSQTCVANDLTAFARQNTGSRSSNAGGSIDASWLSHLSRYLGIYSSRPASLLLHHISGIPLTLHDKDISNLNQLLQSLKYLKSLEVRQRAACISTSR